MYVLHKCRIETLSHLSSIKYNKMLVLIFSTIVILRDQHRFLHCKVCMLWKITVRLKKRYVTSKYVRYIFKKNPKSRFSDNSNQISQCTCNFYQF